MARRNPAFRIAIWGLSLAVLVSLFGVLSVIATGAIAQAPTDSTPIAQVASSGELNGLLEPRGRRTVPDPVEPFQHVAHQSSAGDTVRSEEPFQQEPDLQELRCLKLESELQALRGQVNELSRSQLESQLVEIRHAEQLLTQHQTSREIAHLEHEIQFLKTQVTTLPAATASQTEGDTAQIAPREMPGPVAETTSPEPAAPLRVLPDADHPERLNVEAQNAPLAELATTLGQQLGWNLVAGPEVTGKVTCRWRSVEPELALRQLLKVHGWQIRIEGEFAIVEPLAEAELPPIHLHEPPTQTAALPKDLPQESSPEELWEAARESRALQSHPNAEGDLEPPVPAETPEPERPREFAPTDSAPAPDDSPAKESVAPDAPSVQATPRILPALPATMTHVFRPRHISSQQLLAHVRPLLTQNAGEVTASPADTSQADILLVKDQPGVIARVEELVRVLDVPPHTIQIEATILQLRTAPEKPSGLYQQSLLPLNRGRCPHCGVVHGDEESLAVGHSRNGWVDLGGGLNAGICAMSVDLVAARLKSQTPIAITALAPVEVVDRQLAEIALTEQQGFHRRVSDNTDPNPTAEQLQGGLQLKLRPALRPDGSIQLELNPGLAQSDVVESATLDVTSDQCIVIGGLFFEHQMRITPASTATGEKELHEVVVLIRAQGRARESNQEKR